MKLCKDCKYCHVDGFDKEFSLCNHPKNLVIYDYVNGATKSKCMFCKTMRYSSWLPSLLFGECGSAGRWFEPKDK